MGYNKRLNLQIGTAQFLLDVQDEVESARDKFPSNELLMIALTEEVGELAKALLDESLENILKEAIQVAAMAARIATEGDASIDDYRVRKGLDLTSLENS